MTAIEASLGLLLVAGVAFTITLPVAFTAAVLLGRRRTGRALGIILAGLITLLLLAAIVDAIARTTAS